MSIQELLREKTWVAYGVTAVLLGLAAFLIFSNSRPDTSILGSDRWAFDLNTQKLIRATATQAAPFDTESGPFSYAGMPAAGAGVDTLLFSCGSCDDLQSGMTPEEVATAGGRLVFVTRESDRSIKGQAAQAAAESAAAGDTFMSTMEGTVIANLTGSNWSGAFSGPGLQLRAQAMANCPDTGKTPIECLPR